MADPSTLPGKALWLRAKDNSAGAVTTWLDQSGIHADATGSGGTATTASTPAGGMALVGTSMHYTLPQFTLGSATWLASASSVFGGNYAANAIDADITTMWAANGSTGWLQIKGIDGPVVATSYSITPRNDFTTQDPKTWTFEGSSDATTWTTLDTRTGVTFTKGVKQTFTFSNSTAYLYYRLNITANNGDVNNVSVAELEINGVANTLPDGEMWIVVKTNGGSGPQSWKWGSSGNASHYTYSGSVYEDFGSTTRYSFTPSVDVTQWRLYRVQASGSNWSAWVDNALQSSSTTSTRKWTGSKLALDSFSGAVAEILVFSRATTSSEVSQLISYFNTEHGLSVPGGSSNPSGPVAITGTAGAVSSAGTVTTTGSAAVTGTAGSVSSAGTVAGVNAGSAAITGTPGTVSSTGDVPAPVSGSAAITGHAGTVYTSTGNPPIGPFSLSAKASLTANLPTITLVPMTVSLAAKASLSVATRPVKMLAVSLEAKADLRATLPRHQTVDPVTGLPQYRLMAVQQDGTQLGELPRAAIGDHTTGLALDDENLTFTLPKYDATNALVTAHEGDPVREVQLWRGPNLEAWVKVDGHRPGDGVTEYDCSSLAGYLKGRVVGRTPKTDWLINGNFTRGEYGWSFGYESGSKPAAAPTHSVVTVDFAGSSVKALKLGGADTVTEVKQAVETAAVFVPNSATYLSGGEAKIQAAAASIPNGTNVHIVGHTAYNWLDGDYGDGLALSLARAQAARGTLAAMGKGFTFSLPAGWFSIDPAKRAQDATVGGRGRYAALNGNNTYAEQKVNRRVEFSYSATVTYEASAAQYAQGSLVVGTVMVPASDKRALPITFRGYAYLESIVKASKAGYGVRITLAKASAPTVILQDEHSDLNEDSPVGTWDRHTATVTVPPNGITYVYTARLYAPKGSVLWTMAGVYPAEALNFPDTDRALVVKGLVEHAQDPAMGKLGATPILIGTRTPLTGKKLTVAYPFHERREIADAVSEHTAVYQGVDLGMEFDRTSRALATYFPRRGQISGVTFELGSNVVAYDAPTSVSDAVTRSITQALESSGAEREEGIVTDTSGLGGVLVEKVSYGESGTPITALEAAATSTIVRTGHPVTDLTVTVGRVGRWDPALTSWMLDHVGVGDLVDVVIVDGTTSIVGPHRVIRRILTPDTDTLRYVLAPDPEVA